MKVGTREQWLAARVVLHGLGAVALEDGVVYAYPCYDRGADTARVNVTCVTPLGEEAASTS
jgi:hypothetical protein